MSANKDENIAYYENTIKIAKESIKGVADNLQEKTLHDYKITVKRLLINGQMPITAAKSKGTYYKYRAAWIGYFANDIRSDLIRIEDHKQNNLERWKEGVEEIKSTLTYFDQVKPDPERKNLQLALEYEAAIKAGITPQFEYSNEWREKAKDETIENQRRGLKTRTRKLPKEWRNKLFSGAVEKGSKHLLAIAVMSCTGCRPQELFNTIKIKWIEEKKSIQFEILSAKRKGEKVEFRKFSIQGKDSLAFRYIQSQLFFQRKNEIKLQGINIKAVSADIARTSKKYFKLKEQITSYCFRHAFSGDLHAVGLSAEGIAQALGHASDRTQAYYSHSTKHSSSGFSIQDIESTEPVKSYRNERLEKLFDSQSVNLVMK